MENLEQLNEIRQSIYEYSKTNEESPSGFLTEWRQKGTGKSITKKYSSDEYYLYAFDKGVVSTKEFQRYVKSRHKIKHSLLQETPINDNMTSNEEINDNMTSNEATNDETVNGVSLQNPEGWLERELLPINDALTESKKRRFR